MATDPQTFSCATQETVVGWMGWDPGTGANGTSATRGIEQRSDGMGKAQLENLGILTSSDPRVQDPCEEGRTSMRDLLAFTQ